MRKKPVTCRASSLGPALPWERRRSIPAQGLGEDARTAPSNLAPGATLQAHSDLCVSAAHEVLPEEFGRERHRLRESPPPRIRPASPFPITLRNAAASAIGLVPVLGVPANVPGALILVREMQLDARKRDRPMSAGMGGPLVRRVAVRRCLRSSGSLRSCVHRKLRLRNS